MLGGMGELANLRGLQCGLALDGGMVPGYRQTALYEAYSGLGDGLRNGLADGRDLDTQAGFRRFDHLPCRDGQEEDDNQRCEEFQEIPWGHGQVPCMAG
jgi:hypothetical protein